MTSITDTDTTDMSDYFCVTKLKHLLVDIGLVGTNVSTETVCELLTAITLDNQENLLNIWRTETVRQAELIRQTMKEDMDKLLTSSTGVPASMLHGNVAVPVRASTRLLTKKYLLQQGFSDSEVELMDAEDRSVAKTKASGREDL
jgi:hypothetical protein